MATNKTLVTPSSEVGAAATINDMPNRFDAMDSSIFRVVDDSSLDTPEAWSLRESVQFSDTITLVSSPGYWELVWALDRPFDTETVASKLATDSVYRVFSSTLLDSSYLDAIISRVIPANARLKPGTYITSSSEIAIQSANVLGAAGLSEDVAQLYAYHIIYALMPLGIVSLTRGQFKLTYRSKVTPDYDDLFAEVMRHEIEDKYRYVPLQVTKPDTKEYYRPMVMQSLKHVFETLGTQLKMVGYDAYYLDGTLEAVRLIRLLPHLTQDELELAKELNNVPVLAEMANNVVLASIAMSESRSAALQAIPKWEQKVRIETIYRAIRSSKRMRIVSLSEYAMTMGHSVSRDQKSRLRGLLAYNNVSTQAQCQVMGIHKAGYVDGYFIAPMVQQTGSFNALISRVLPSDHVKWMISSIQDINQFGDYELTDGENDLVVQTFAMSEAELWMYALATPGVNAHMLVKQVDEGKSEFRIGFRCDFSKELRTAPGLSFLDRTVTFDPAIALMLTADREPTGAFTIGHEAIRAESQKLLLLNDPAEKVKDVHRPDDEGVTWALDSFTEYSARVNVGKTVITTGIDLPTLLGWPRFDDTYVLIHPAHAKIVEMSINVFVNYFRKHPIVVNATASAGGATAHESRILKQFIADKLAMLIMRVASGSDGSRLVNHMIDLIRLQGAGGADTQELTRAIRKYRREGVFLAQIEFNVAAVALTSSALLTPKTVNAVRSVLNSADFFERQSTNSKYNI